MEEMVIGTGEAFRKIRCQNEHGGRICGRWLARIEDGRLYIRCPRCNQDEDIELSSLAREYRDWLKGLSEELGQSDAAQ
jgi:phage FluMu protein Com